MLVYLCKCIFPDQWPEPLVNTQPTASTTVSIT